MLIDILGWIFLAFAIVAWITGCEKERRAKERETRFAERLAQLEEYHADLLLIVESFATELRQSLNEQEPDTSDIPEAGEEFFKNARLLRPPHSPDERAGAPASPQ
jgi:hypothetical protein